MTTELFGVRVLIVFIMVKMTFYAYVIIIHTVMSHEQTQSFFLFFLTDEPQPSVPSVEQKRNHLEIDTLPESRWQPYKNISPRERRKYSQLLHFLQNKLEFLSLDRVVNETTEEEDPAAAISI